MLRGYFGAKSTQNSVESQKSREFRKLLDREEEDHNDLVSLPVLDSQFNNSQKLKLYSKYLTENLDFEHLLLTDDTTFLFTQNILPMLDNMQSSSKLWWSAFDVFKKTGEFAENYVDKFTSLTYPPVPQTQTMLMSSHHVHYLANNVHFLKQFSSLQTSVGVWLSSVETKRHQDQFWNMKACLNKTIDKSFLACSNLSSDDMKTIWNKMRKRH